MAIITAKAGSPLPAGQILAEKGQKGVQREVLGEGRHFLNPYLFDHEIRGTLLIPAGKVGIVLSKVGKALPQGEFLAGDKDEQGIWRQVLGPGRYRLNPHGYDVEVVDAVSIPIGYAGVMTSLSGTRPAAGAFATADQKGVREEILQPGLYYINPRQYKVDVLEIGINQVSLLGREGGRVVTKTAQVTQNAAMNELQSNLIQEQSKQRRDYIRGSRLWSSVSKPRPAAPPAQPARQGVMRQAQPAATAPGMSSLGLSEFVEFPSRDGFQIRLDMTVEVELLPAELAGIFRSYGDLPALVDKIILPQIMSISRNKGSEYRAKDFIVGEGREKFQSDLKAALAQALGEKRVIVHNALIRHVDVPAEILAPIQQASIAIEQDLTNRERQNTAKRQAELNTQQALIEQARQQVEQETSKLQAEIRADMEKQVAEVQAEAKRQVAQIVRDAATIKADTVRRLAQAEAASLELVSGESAKGLQLKTAAFADQQAFALWTLAMNLNPAIRVRVLHAGEGTLWTDLEKATFGDLGGARIIQPAVPAR
jgi:regulator of protease activity HflC (stomatin/prohibitin superfamily)